MNSRTPATGLRSRAAVSGRRQPASRFGTRGNTFRMRGSDQQRVKVQIEGDAPRGRILGIGQRPMGRPVDGRVENRSADGCAHVGDAFKRGRQSRTGFNEPARRQGVRGIIRRLSAAWSDSRHVHWVGNPLGLVPTTGHAAVLQTEADRSQSGGKDEQSQQDMERFGCR